MVVDPDTRGQLAKEGRLWLLSMVCATAGATGVYLSDSIAIGVAVFLACLAVFGGILLAYERHKR
jgi:hypothetical protein